MLPQWYVKDAGHSAKKAGDRLQLNMRTPTTQHSWNTVPMLSRHSMVTYQGNELTHNLSGNNCPQSSQLAKPLWFDPGLDRGIGVHKLIATKKCRHGMMIHRIFPFPKSSHATKKPPPPPNNCSTLLTSSCFHLGSSSSRHSSRWWSGWWCHPLCSPRWSAPQNSLKKSECKLTWRC